MTQTVKAGSNIGSTVRLALFQPDIAPNVGAIIRLAACMSVPLDIIEPCGFPFSPAAVRRQVMDYGDKADVTRHSSWTQFESDRPPGRLLAMTTHGAQPLWDFDFQSGDMILMGRESAGLPEDIHAIADARLVIPMADGTRSLNIAIAAGMAVAEAIRQIRKRS